MTTLLWLLGKPAYGPADGRAELAVSLPVVLLAYLALQENWVSRQHLATLFWPDAAEGGARRNLRRLISRIGEVPFADGVEIQADRLRWSVGTDVRAFRQALGQGDWRGATELYNGQLLSGFEPGSDGVRTWLDLERANLFASFKDAAHERSLELDSLAEHDAVGRIAQHILELDPFAEEFVRLRMRSAYLSGHRFEALQTFDAFRQLLDEELGLEPAEETVSLHRQLSDSAETGLQPAQSRQLVPVALLQPLQLVGRENELQQLADSAGRPVLIAGEPGVGKTRLLQAGTAADTAYMRCVPDLSLQPFHPLIRLISDRVDRGEAQPDLGDYQREFASLLPGPHAETDNVERSRLLEASALYLERSGSLVLFDDLQWADTATLELITYLCERGRPALRGAYRAAEVGPALQRTLDSLVTVSIIQLRPIDSAAMGDLLASLTGRSEPPRQFAAWLQQLTAGNPLFALETLRSLFEARILRLEDEDWRTPIDTFTSDYSELPEASAVRDVIRRRTDRLGEYAQRVLRAIAVLGDSASPMRVARMTALDEWQVLAAAEEAHAAGLLNGMVFAHDLLRTAVYYDMGPAVRGHLHREAAAQFTDPLVRANHLAAAGDSGDAIPLWFEAHGQLMLKGLYEEALAILDTVAAADPDESWRMDVLARRASALQGLTHNEEALQLARQVLQGTIEPRLRASAHETYANAQLLLGNLKDAEFHAQSGLELLDSDDSMAVELAHLKGSTLYYQGRVEEAAAEISELVSKVRANGPVEQLPALLTSLGSIHDAQESFEQGLSLHREAHRLAADLGQRYVQVSAILNMLYSLIDLGRPEEGLDLAEQALVLGRYSNSDSLRTNLASAYRAAGQPDKAAAHYRELAGTTTDPSLQCVALTNLAQFAHEAGDAEAVRTHLNAALTEVEQTTFPVMRAKVAVALALYGGTDGDMAAARALLSGVDDSALPHWLQPDLRKARARL